MLTSKKKRRRVTLWLLLSFLVSVVFILFSVTSLQYMSPNFIEGSSKKNQLKKQLAKQVAEPAPFLTKSSSFRPISVQKWAAGLVIESLNTRPDRDFMPILATAKVVGSGASLDLSGVGTKCYLQVGEDQALEKSATASPLFIEPAQGVKKTFSLHYIDHLGQEECASIKYQSKKKLTKSCDYFKEAKLLGPDQLVLNYSKEKAGQNKQRLCLESAGRATCLPIEEGDCFTISKQGWRKVEPSEESAKSDLFQIKHYDEKEVVLVLWQQGDLEGQEIRVKRYHEKPIAFNPTQSISEIKRRALSTISCRFNKKLHVFRLGDWVIEGDKGWHLVKHVEELDHIVGGTTTGCLMVFDDLVQNSGKKTVVGKVFSPYRTLCTEFALELGGKEKGKRGPREKERRLPKRGNFNSRAKRKGSS